MSDQKSDQSVEKVDRFAQKYKLWLVIPLVISGLTALRNPHAGLGLLLFFVFGWLFLWAIGKILCVIRWMLPKSLTQHQSNAICEAAGATLFLGGSAIVGIVLRNDNVVSDWVDENAPSGMSLAIVDPVFAAAALLGLWVYTGYRVNR